jgi:hypothetical protein
VGFIGFVLIKHEAVTIGAVVPEALLSAQRSSVRTARSSAERRIALKHEDGVLVLAIGMSANSCFPFA